MYIGTYGTVAGYTEQFDTMSRVIYGCPLSSLLFGLFFNRIVAHIESTLHPSDAVSVANVAVWVALCANNIVLMSPNVPGLMC